MNELKKTRQNKDNNYIHNLGEEPWRNGCFFQLLPKAILTVGRADRLLHRRPPEQRAAVAGELPWPGGVAHGDPVSEKNFGANYVEDLGILSKNNNKNYLYMKKQIKDRITPHVKFCVFQLNMRSV